MTESPASAISPSSRLLLYLAAVLSVYLVRDPRASIIIAAAYVAVAMGVARSAARPVPPVRWRAAIVFLAWVFLMRLALELVTGVAIDDAAMWLTASQQAARVAVLAIGVIALIAVTRPREIVDELEESRVPRSARILVMMLVQYPRVLRDRYDQIVEAQVARGADRPRSIAQRVTHGASLLLPVMQSELNAIGDRATLILLRGLDHPVTIIRFGGGVSRPDIAARTVAALLVIAAIATRIVS